MYSAFHFVLYIHLYFLASKVTYSNGEVFNEKHQFLNILKSLYTYLNFRELILLDLREISQNFQLLGVVNFTERIFTANLHSTFQFLVLRFHCLGTTKYSVPKISWCDSIYNVSMVNQVRNLNDISAISLFRGRVELRERGKKNWGRG